jgi:uncharacterized membrane protein YhaH (DUF805 family)
VQQQKKKSNPLREVVTMNQLFSVRGRLGRSNYQNQYLFSLGVSALFLLFYEMRDIIGFQELAFMFTLVGLGFSFVCMLTAAIRRLHDLDRPAWHLVLTLVPVYNLYLIMSLLCTKGEEEINPYGQRPEPLN